MRSIYEKDSANTTFRLTGMNTVDASSIKRPVKLNPITGKPVERPTKMSMPIRGLGVAMTDKLGELSERRERMEMMNY